MTVSVKKSLNINEDMHLKWRIEAISYLMNFRPFLIAMAAICLMTACHHRRSKDPYSALARGSAHSPATIDHTLQAMKIQNLYYTERHPRSIMQTMDLYLPLDKSVKQPFPVIIWIHGGSWIQGDKNMDCLACQLFSKRYAVASVNYRLTSETSFPGQINDMKAAVRFLRANAKKYKLDPNRIAVWGSSAGGYLGALLGTAGDVKELEGKSGHNNQSSRVQAVIDWSGPTNLNTIQSQAGPNIKIRFDGPGTAVYSLMGARMDKQSLANASPVTYASKDDPPFLIMHGDQDDAIPPAQSQELCEVLRNAGVDVNNHVLAGYGHSFGAPEHYKLVEDFLDRTIGSPKRQ